MKYGFIGCGNMGGALAVALGQHTCDALVSDRSGKAAALADRLGFTYSTNARIAAECNRIFLGVKPKMIKEVLTELSGMLSDRKPLIISMAAGVRISTIEETIGSPVPVIRMMPNTPVEVGMGLIPYCVNGLVPKEILQDFLQDMSAAGTLDQLDEDLMDVASALSGSGPAYMFAFAQALADGAIGLGMDPKKAILYASTTMAGAAEMLLRSGRDPEDLKNAVCSPGGSTLEGLKALNEQTFRESVIRCIQAANEKNIQMGKQV